MSCHRLLSVFVVAGAPLLTSAQSALPVDSNGDPAAAHEVVFKVSAPIDPNLDLDLARNHFGTAYPLFSWLDKNQNPDDYWYVVEDADPQPNKNRTPEELASALQLLDRRITAEPDYSYNLQGLAPGSEAPLSRSPWFPAGRQEGAAAPTLGSPGIAIFDTGISQALGRSDPRFSRAYWPMRTTAGNGQFDVVIEGKTVPVSMDAVGFNPTAFVQPGIPSESLLLNVDDEDGHGTHCAGIVASYTTPLGNAASSAYILPCKIVFQGGSRCRWIADAVSFVIQSNRQGASNIRVISLSWGGAPKSQLLYSALKLAQENNILVVCSAGNGHESSDLFPRYPASFSLPTTIQTLAGEHRLKPLSNILTVASVDWENKLARTSNYGLNSVLACAVGERVASADLSQTKQYSEFSGTSAAAAKVSGAAGALLTSFPELTPEQLKWTLVRTAGESIPYLNYFALSHAVIDPNAVTQLTRASLESSPSFQPLCSPGFLKIRVGESAETEIYLQPINGFSRSVTIAAALKPTGTWWPGAADFTFTPRFNPIVPGSSAKLKVSTGPTTRPGLYYITLSAMQGTQLRQTILEVSVY